MDPRLIVPLVGIVAARRGEREPQLPAIVFVQAAVGVEQRPCIPINQTITDRHDIAVAERGETRFLAVSRAGRRPAQGSKLDHCSILANGLNGKPRHRTGGCGVAAADQFVRS